MNMPRALEKYQAVDEEQGLKQNIIQAQPVEPATAPLLTLLHAETPKLTRQSFISKVYITLCFST